MSAVRYHGVQKTFDTFTALHSLDLKVPDRSFMARLTQAGFHAEAVATKAYAKSKRRTHTLFVADWNG